MIGTSRASKQPKPTPGPPVVLPPRDEADNGRWSVVDYRGYVIFCGAEEHARRYVDAYHMAEAARKHSRSPRL